MANRAKCECDTSATLFTASWRGLWEASKAGVLTVQPVRTSVGVPRFWPEARGFPTAKLITPYGLRKLTEDEFDTAYIARLEETGVDAIRAELAKIAGLHGKPLVLLCFERSRTDCHRGSFAQWLEQQTGVVVPEWTGAPPTRAEQLQFDSTTDEKGGAA